jgi:hypothetical protein
MDLGGIKYFVELLHDDLLIDNSKTGFKTHPGKT